MLPDQGLETVLHHKLQLHSCIAGLHLCDRPEIDKLFVSLKSTRMPVALGTSGSNDMLPRAERAMPDSKPRGQS